MNFTDADANNERGFALESLENYQGAIDDYTQAISLNPENDYSNYLFRGFARKSLNDYQGAIDDYTKAISLQPDYDSVYLFRASARESQEDYQGAIKDCQKAVDLYVESGDMEGYQNAIAMQKRLRLVRSWS